MNARMAALEPEDTIGDDNCALNAVALCLANADLIRHHKLFLQHNDIDPDDAFADFIKAVAGIFDLEPTWDAVTEGMIRVRQHDKLRYQRSLAPMLRNLMVTEMEKDDQCIEWTINELLSGARDEIYRRIGIHFKGSLDDVYTKQKIVQDQINLYEPEIRAQLKRKAFNIDYYNYLKGLNSLNKEEEKSFAELSDQLDDILKPFEDRLIRWWRNGDNESSGFKQFLRALRGNGEWISYLALRYLAIYFHLDLYVYMNGCWEDIHLNKLQMPRHLIKTEAVEQLLSRNVIEPYKPKDEYLTFLPYDSLKQLQDRLSDLPNMGDAINYFFEHQGIKKKEVPAIFSTMKEQLRLRNIIEQSGNTHVFSVDQDEAYRRSIEMVDADIVIKWWQAHHYPAPRMVLRNAREIHWENMISTEPYDMVLPKPKLKAKDIPPVVLVGLFLACYVAMVNTLSRVEIAAAVAGDPDSPRIPRLSPALRMASYAPLEAGTPAQISAISFGLFKPKQIVNGNELAIQTTKTPLSPTLPDTATLMRALQRLPCTLI